MRQNKGGLGIDGMTVEQLPDYLREHWPRLRERLLAGSYQPQPVRRHALPKRGGGVRELGIPTVLDRFIQQALLQVLQPPIDPSFSRHSYGFRPGRRAYEAILAAQAFVQDGRSWVVDVELEKFFDRVNHDVLLGKLAVRIVDRRVLGLIRRYLEAGVMADGVVIEWHEGTPQGGPFKRAVAKQALGAMKERVRQITGRSGGRSIEQVVEELRGYLVGWREYFRLAQTPGVLGELDQWLRHRLRALHLKHWKRGTVIYRGLRARGLTVYSGCHRGRQCPALVG